MDSRAGNLTIPNALTLARILMTPVFVVLFLDGRHMTALALFFAAGITDALDGFLARVLNQRSELGGILDPLADKLLLNTSIVCIAHAAWIPGWLAVAVVSRDVIILGGIATLAFLGQEMRGRVTPSKVSKLTTVSQMALVLAAFLHEGTGLKDPALDMLLDGLVWATGGLTLFSGWRYVVKGLNIFKGMEQKD
jgi:cardiolipin synthase